MSATLDAVLAQRPSAQAQAPTTQRRRTPMGAAGNAPVAHIVAPDGKREAAAIVTEARIYGTEVEALCGHRWVPQRDPKQLPVCEGCKQEWERLFGVGGEGPRDA